MIPRIERGNRVNGSQLGSGGLTLVEISGYVSLAASLATFLTGLVTIISVFLNRRKGAGKHEKTTSDSD